MLREAIVRKAIPESIVARSLQVVRLCIEWPDAWVDLTGSADMDSETLANFFHAINVIATACGCEITLKQCDRQVSFCRVIT